MNKILAGISLSILTSLAYAGGGQTGGSGSCRIDSTETVAVCKANDGDSMTIETSKWSSYPGRTCRFAGTSTNLARLRLTLDGVERYFTFSRVEASGDTLIVDSISDTSSREEILAVRGFSRDSWSKEYGLHGTYLKQIDRKGNFISIQLSKPFNCQFKQ